MNNNKKTSVDFEKNMQRLEEIVAGFDEGQLTLDQMEAYFAEGMELLNSCAERLDQVETRITKLMQEHKDKWKDVPLDENPE